MDIVNELRAKESRDNRKLLNRAADEIERLRDENEKIKKSIASERIGEWIPTKQYRDIGNPHYFELPKCNKCGLITNKGYNYCPNCGAKMNAKKTSMLQTKTEEY